MQTKIDFVLPWVDGNDKEWHAEKSKYVPGYNTDNSIVRYRDWDNLHFIFRGIEKFAPWVNNVFFVTSGHLPKWLNKEHPKLKIVNHKDYIPHEYLPTFSSHAIELNFHRIKDLSEHFICFNDDMFLIKDIKPEDFFKNGKPCDMAIMNSFIPTTEFSHIDFNNIWVINKHFKKRKAIANNLLKWFNPVYGTMNFLNLLLLSWNGMSRFISCHLPQPYLKKTFQEVWTVEGELLDRTCKNKFRSRDDINHWLFRYWRLMKGEFTPISVPRLGKMVELSDNKKRNSSIYKSIIKQKYPMICVNDVENKVNFELEKQRLKNAFEHIFPEKSNYEISQL